MSDQSRDVGRASDALRAIPSDLQRDGWMRVGMAAKVAGITFEEFDSWSSTAETYTASDARAAWNSFKDQGSVGAGTLYYVAKQHGWDSSRWRKSKDAVRQLSSRSPTPGRAVAPSAKSRPGMGMGAAEVWARCEPATAAHGYILAKTGRPEGLRVVPAGDPLRIAGQSMAGALVVPVVPLAGGDPVSLQFIAAPVMAAQWKAAGRPSKLNLPGAAVAGVFTVGELEPAGTAFLCEGIGQAWACWKATGRAAVVCFGWGRVRAVAAELRQRDASARLVLVPDVGKEAEAQAIACEVGAAVAAMPEGWPVNADANDLAQRDGSDVLEKLLSGASEPPKPEVAVHPLARFIDLDAEPMAPRFVIPGFIGAGVVVIAGGHGIGKTSAILPLAMVVAGLHGRGDPLAPKHWRHVVYITEDTEQAWRMVTTVRKFGGLGLDAKTVRERLHFAKACRLQPVYVAQVAKTYREHFTRVCGGVEVPPLVVFDTKSAVFQMEDENSNSEGSAIVALLKQSFEGLPVWLVGHIAKNSMGRSDVAALSLRGGSAFEADANQVLYFLQEGDARRLVRGKTRFEADWQELAFRTHTVDITAPDEYGDPKAVTLRWCIAHPPEQRKEAQEQAQKAARRADAAALRREVLEVVQLAWQSRCPLNRFGVKTQVKRRGTVVQDCIEELLSERWLLEVEVPKKERTNPNRSSFFVSMDPHEHDAVVRGEGWPAYKQVIPDAWRKPVAPSVPELERTDIQISPVVPQEMRIASVPIPSVP